MFFWHKNVQIYIPFHIITWFLNLWIKVLSFWNCFSLKMKLLFISFYVIMGNNRVEKMWKLLSRVLFMFLFLRRKSGLALCRMGFKVPFCRYQFARKRWVQVQGKMLQSGLILCFCCKRNFSPISAAGLTFLLCSKTSCCAIKSSAMQ